MRIELNTLYDEVPDTWAIVQALKDNPGSTRNRLRTLTGLSERQIIEAIVALKLGDQVKVTTAFGMEFHWLPGQKIVEPKRRSDVHPGRKGYPKQMGAGPCRG